MTEVRLFVEQFSSPTGPMMLLTDVEHNVRALDWQDCAPRMHRLLRLRYGPVRLELKAAPSDARRAVEAYYAGALETIAAIPIITVGTAFQRALWAALRTVPAGETTTYGQLAARLGRPRAVRAVGAANGANPISLIVPCHRVIGANATLTGYGGGLERKRWLLRHENPRWTTSLDPAESSSDRTGRMNVSATTRG